VHEFVSTTWTVPVIPVEPQSTEIEFVPCPLLTEPPKIVQLNEEPAEGLTEYVTPLSPAQTEVSPEIGEVTGGLQLEVSPRAYSALSRLIFVRLTVLPTVATCVPSAVQSLEEFALVSRRVSATIGKLLNPFARRSRS
jgi:hypothetical protein